MKIQLWMYLWVAEKSQFEHFQVLGEKSPGKPNQRLTGENLLGKCIGGKVRSSLWQNPSLARGFLTERSCARTMMIRSLQLPMQTKQIQFQLRQTPKQRVRSDPVPKLTTRPQSAQSIGATATSPNAPCPKQTKVSLIMNSRAVKIETQAECYR